jgi:quinol-cytochrome oxidoreductase complex cytochrome b subunit
MKPPADFASGVINLDHPGTYLHWSFIDVSVANLVLIAVMVVIFGLALILPFPPGHTYPPAAEPAGPAASRAGQGADEDQDMWTSKARRLALRILPPGKLLPDRQPAYVRSWVYVFGVASLAAFAVACASGFALALGGPDWWRDNPAGHFCNSLHLWSVELFMALLVIHLWGKFWMAAWRGRRAMTWITGVAAFLVSVVECFTGYLSQQNFDSQWISTSGKDAFNAAGIGAIWNAMNFGQMLMWHIVLVPIALTAIIGAHILLVRVRGVTHPLPATARLPGQGSYRQRRRALAAADAAPWHGPARRYDILKEGTIAAVIILALTAALAALLSSPNVPELSVQTWARVAPADFLATAATELNATSATATYGPPYNTNGTPQKILFAPANIPGVTQPINTARDFVLTPLNAAAAGNPALAAALATYHAAPPAQQLKWASAYATAVTKVKFPAGTPVVPAAADGPVPVMLASELTMARSGALDTDLLARNAFYGTNYTLPLMFINDGSYFASQAETMHLGGDQWGVMNETGSYPGQPWLWLYTLWYSTSWGNSPNADLIAIYMTGTATILLLLIPFIPGLRDIPRLIPVHRLIWRAGKEPPSDRTPPPAGTSGPVDTATAGTN